MPTGSRETHRTRMPGSALSSASERGRPRRPAALALGAGICSDERRVPAPGRRGGLGRAVPSYRSFTVARAASASMPEMIQSRMTTFVSARPVCCIWWWNGAR